MSALVLSGLEAGYKGTDVLRGVSLTVEPGACVGLLGPNGAGKSTLLKAVSGQIRPRGGRRTLDGVDITSWKAHRSARAGIRWVGDPRPIYPTLSVADNLEIGGTLRRRRVEQRRAEVYDLLPQLRDKRHARAGSLSGGQQQMLAIGQALMSEPRFLCLDEPSLGLASVVIHALSELIGELVAAGMGVIWAEQFPEVALRRCGHVLVLGAGTVVIEGPPAAISRDQLEAAYLGRPAGELAASAPTAEL